MTVHMRLETRAHAGAASSKGFVATVGRRLFLEEAGRDDRQQQSGVSKPP